MKQVIERKFSPSSALALRKSGFSATMAKLLAGRGIKSKEEVMGDISGLIPYTEMKDCVEAATFLKEAISKKTRLLIVSDYDADGATACAIGYRALNCWGANIGYLIPNRLEHGYGLTPEIVDVAAALVPKPEVIITVDNGIASHAGIDRAHEHGIKVLVTDHHLPAATLPSAEFIVNPNRPDCTFESKNIAGCGVIWYVMWALYDMLDEGTKFGLDVKDLLSIAAIGTVADVVRLDGNNRILVTEGLRLIRQGKGFAGIKALARAAKRNVNALTTMDIGFALGPRINAAGRLESMDKGVICLTTDEPSEAEALSQELTAINERRKELEAKMVTDASIEIFEQDFKVSEKFSLCVSNDNWHQGVIGIVAGRLKEKYFRPTFALAPGKAGEFKGSGRSIPGLHLRDALDLLDKQYPGVLLKFGGHAMAAGVTVAPGKLEDFKIGFEAVCSKMLTAYDLQEVIETDGPIAESELNLETASELELAVWGQGFPAPLFSDTFEVLGYKHLGENGEHLRMTVRKGSCVLQAIKFRNEIEDIPKNVKLVYQLSINEWRDNVSLQLLVQHLDPV